jgi:Tol biopolymer transport system component/tRNA A-37 threonylcarbamoyl transferase component Bud32
MVGDRLGRYVIEERIGAGGMGTVYRARDPQLQRTVAIKVVTRAPEGDEKAAALAEARAASALNHPNICTVHEVGEQGSVAYIVAEFIEGRSLAQLIPHAGLPPETVIRYGIQIADALAHAHDHGVIHRDLKSSNVVIAKDGRAKVLDFGLARRVSTALAGAETHSKSAETDAGPLAGTLAYMPPEQLLGQPGDPRGDVWSLGVLLYEMASGTLPFRGRNQFELTAAILRGAPEHLPPHVPPMVRQIIARCLAKEPDQRYQRASEARAALEAVHSDFALEAAAVPRSTPRRLPWAIVAGVAVVVATVALVLLLPRARRQPDAPWMHTAEAGHLVRLLSSDTHQFRPAISPDGQLVAYTAQDATGHADLFVRQTSGGRPVQLTDDEAHETTPAFSSDGQRVAFARRRVRDEQPEACIMPALGGDVRCVVRGVITPAWSPSGDRLAFVRPAGSGNPFELVTVGADGADPVVLLRGDGAYPFLRNPSWSPDGRSLAVVRGSGGIAGELWLVPSAGGPPRRVSNDPAMVSSDWPVFTPDGAGLVHSSNRGGATNIWVQPLDGRAPVRLTTGPGPDERPTVARDGTIAFVNSRWRSALILYDLVTRQLRTLATHTPFMWGPAFSPDGRRIAFSRSEVDGSWHLWTIATNETTPSKLTETPLSELYPRFTPDGAWVLYQTWAPPRSVWRVPVAGGAPERLAHIDGGGAAYADVSPDGRWIAYTREEGDAERIYIVGVGGGPSRLLLPSRGTVPRWSPDGRRIAFSPDRSRLSGIFVVDAGGGTPARLAEDGGWPVWWPDGRKVAYVGMATDDSQELRVVPVDGGPWRRLEGLHFRGVNHPFDISRDGRRVVTSNAELVSDEIWLLQPLR